MKVVKYRLGRSKKFHSMAVEDLLDRFSESKEAESYTKYYYPFPTCFHKFWSSQPEILQDLSAGQISLLEQKFKRQYSK